MARRPKRHQAANPEETLGSRLARLRKARGLTQTELAERVGTLQTMVSEYELDRRRLHAEMILRLAQARGVSADELLGLKASRQMRGAVSLKLTRRLQRIEALPPARQKLVLQTLDTLLRGAGQ